MRAVDGLVGSVYGVPNGEGVPSTWIVAGLPKGLSIVSGIADHFAHYFGPAANDGERQALRVIEAPGMRHCIHCGGLIPTFQTTCRHCGKEN